MTDDLYAKMTNACKDEDLVREARNGQTYRSIEVLMAEDFPDNCEDLIELYSLNSYAWLRKYLLEKENHFAYFGELSAAIHHVFIADPRPFRKDIKQYLNVLLSTIETLEDPLFRITRPNYSSKVELL